MKFVTPLVGTDIQFTTFDQRHSIHLISHELRTLSVWIKLKKPRERKNSFLSPKNEKLESADHRKSLKC